jgi:hypothetical protein
MEVGEKSSEVGRRHTSPSLALNSTNHAVNQLHSDIYNMYNACVTKENGCLRPGAGTQLEIGRRPCEHAIQCVQGYSVMSFACDWAL